MIERVLLDAGDVRSIKPLLAEIQLKHGSVEDPELHHQASVYAHDLPRRLRSKLNDMKRRERPSALIFEGYPIEQEKIGLTPARLRGQAQASSTFEEEALLLLLGSLLGTTIGWSTQQDGAMVHDILPVQGLENEQLGAGSEVPLAWHVEDAFHPHRADYLGLLCLRNPDQVPTTYLSIDMLELSEKSKSILFQKRFTIRPDESHLIKHKAEPSDVDDELADAYTKIERMNSKPEKIAVLFGDPEAPYLRIDPHFMDPLEDDPEAQAVLDQVIQQIDGKLEDLVLQAGDYCFIDNYQAVHGRKPFRARYDGQDRWLKRINVARDLRASRAFRPTAESPILF